MEKYILTIGIPVYNEEKSIGRLLSQIQNQTNPGKVQIIVVSSGSTDQTNSIVSKFTNVELIVQPKRMGKVSALKLIWQRAKGSIILMTDGDVTLCDDTIKRMVDSFNNPETVACTGQVKQSGTGGSLIRKISDLSCLAWHNLRIRNYHKGEFVYPSGYLYAFRLNLLPLLNIDPCVINDDAIIGQIIYGAGFLFQYEDRAIVKVHFPDNITDLINQKIRTRLGRRRTSNHLFLACEKKWRKEIYKLIGKTEFTTIISLLGLDLFSRIVANLKIFSPGDHHIWKPILSTKK